MVLEDSSGQNDIADVCALTSGAAKDPLLMDLLHSLHFFLASYQIVVMRAFSGYSESATDAVLHNHLSFLFQLFFTGVKVPLPNPTFSDEYVNSSAAQIGPVPVGGECFYLPWAGVSTSYKALIYFRPTLVLKILATNKFVTSTSDRTLCHFHSLSGQKGLTHQTIKCCLSALHYKQIKLDKVIHLQQ